MKKNIILIFSLFLIVTSYVVYYLLKPSKSQSQKMTGTRYIQFMDLPDDLIALSGDIKILKSEINDKALQNYNIDREELLLASALKQFVVQKGGGKKVILYAKQPSRSLEEVLIRYNVKLDKSLKIQFSQPQEGRFLQVGNKNYAQSDMSKTDYMWGAYQSKVFQRQIEIIEQMIVRKAIIKASVQEKLSTEEYITQKILKGEKNKETPEQIDLVRDYVKNNLLELPIKVGIEVPDFQFDVKPDWTPSLGDLESEVQVLMFSDFLSLPAQVLLNSVPDLYKKYPQVYFGLRPLFFESDRYQRMLAEYTFCVWEYDQEKVWNFIPMSTNLTKKDFESKLYAVAEKNELSLIPIKTCFIERVHKNIVDYHLDYGKFLGILSGPVVMIDGEVLEGVVTKERIDEVLKRKTWLRDPKNREKVN